MNLRYLVPFFDPSVHDWAVEARLLRWLTFLWLLVGLVVLFSASYPVAEVDFGNGLYYFERQLVWVLVGLIGFSILVHSPIRYILGFAAWGMVFCLGLILLTLVPGMGTTVNGATRWLSLGPLPVLQPSELIKPFLVLQSARVFGYWDRFSAKTRLIWLGLFVLLLISILLQPNLSTAALCGMLIWLIALAAGLPYLYLGGTAIAGFCAATLSISIRDYQRERVMSFMNPWADPSGNGFQLIQSLLAIGSGGVTGVGYGMSMQKLSFLPIQFTDFIFAVFAEEFGLIGSFLLLLLLAAYATVGWRVSTKARTPVHQLVAIGITTLLVGQSLLNIGVATGALPTTGLPLPLFSYGGSSMIASLLCAGILIRVARESNEADVLSLQERRKLKEGRS